MSSNTKSSIPQLTPEQQKFVLKVQKNTRKGATPGRVLKTFYPANVTVCGHQVSQCGLGVLGLLELIDHPFVSVMLGKDDRGVTIQDQQRAFFIFKDPRAARDLIAQDMDTFDRAVFDLCEGLTPAALGEITAKLTQLIRDGLSTIPGVNLDAKGADEAPLEPAEGTPSPNETPA